VHKLVSAETLTYRQATRNVLSCRDDGREGSPCAREPCSASAVTFFGSNFDHGERSVARPVTGRPVREQAQTFVTPHVQFIVDGAGMQVRRKRRIVGGEDWEEHLQISWSAVTAIGFATGRHDPIVALYAWPATGKPNHVADSRLLNDSEWTQLGELVAEATYGRLVLDVDGRHSPKSIWPDWRQCPLSRELSIALAGKTSCFYGGSLS
jgi:hypothetical protein